jgi:hypothetical protein
VRNNSLLIIVFGLMISSILVLMGAFYPEVINMLTRSKYTTLLENKSLTMLGKVIIAVYLLTVKLVVENLIL